MGHISNSKGLRLGVSTSWPVSYNINIFNKNQYINLSNILAYIDKFFSNKIFEKRGILFLNTLIEPIFGTGSFKVTVFFIDTRFLSVKKVNRKKYSDDRRNVLLLKSLFNNFIPSIIRGNINKFAGKDNFFFDFVPMNFSNINSLFLVKYLSKKLQQRFTLNEILRSTVVNLKSKIYDKNFKSPLLGYRFSCAGRFTRKQRATFLWERFGRMSLNTLTASVDYSFFPVKLKNGVCGLKFWIFLDWNRYNLNSRLILNARPVQFFDCKWTNLKYFYNINHVIKTK